MEPKGPDERPTHVPLETLTEPRYRGGSAVRARTIASGAGLVAAGVAVGLAIIFLVIRPADVPTVPPETSPTPDTLTVPPQEGLPEPVAATRAAIASAASARDFDALRELIDPASFTYSFGGGRRPIAHLRRLDARGERPLETLVAILQMPYTKAGDVYVWPFAYDRDPETLTAEERELLSAIATEDEIRSWVEFGGYLGWRAGIRSDGVWVFYVAGD